MKKLKLITIIGTRPEIIRLSCVVRKFDQFFIDLARSVYITNDKRSEIKNEINKKFGSTIVEVKSYKKY